MAEVVVDVDHGPTGVRQQLLDHYIRHFEVRVPPDAVAHIHEDLARAALQMMERNMAADITPARG